MKDQVEQLLTLTEKNWERELREEEPLLDAVVLNRVFVGNPGTGKTTVAAIYGRLLGEMGLLSKGAVLLKSPSDFIGDVLGSSERATREILKAAEGCVLVIDEAYSLCPNRIVTPQRGNDVLSTPFCKGYILFYSIPFARARGRPEGGLAEATPSRPR